MITASKELGNLILNRSPGLAVKIGNDILVTYLGQDENNAARLRITAPKEISISRVKSVNEQLNKL